MQIIHIDFGDCFEAAQEREKYPERVPFRLTRMLRRAMEVGGVSGTFRTTCEKTMLVLRQNKDSLLAVLEAFVYDPLLSWKLVKVRPLYLRERVCVCVRARSKGIFFRFRSVALVISFVSFI